MNTRTTGIIGCASTICIKYQKWVGPSIDTTDPSHSEFQVWCSSVAWFWSYSLPNVSPNNCIKDVLSDSVPCLFSKATVSEIFCSIRKLHEPDAARQRFVGITDSSTEGCC